MMRRIQDAKKFVNERQEEVNRQVHSQTTTAERRLRDLNARRAAERRAREQEDAERRRKLAEWQVGPRSLAHQQVAASL